MDDIVEEDGHWLNEPAGITIAQYQRKIHVHKGQRMLAESQSCFNVGKQNRSIYAHSQSIFSSHSQALRSECPQASQACSTWAYVRLEYVLSLLLRLLRRSCLLVHVVVCIYQDHTAGR